MQARTLLGLSCYGTGQFVEAGKHLEIASKANPSNPELHNVLAQSCLLGKNYDCALNEFTWILQRNPNSAAVHILTGEALAELDLAAKADPRTPNVNFGLGYLYWKMRRYNEAAAAFNNELAVDPQNAQ